jgi:hypothetical protein
MAKIGGKHGQITLDIRTRTVEALQGSNGKRMTIMPRAA